MTKEQDYHDVPGTTVFDAAQSRAGYHLNQFCMSLMKSANRARFKENEAKYLDEWNLTPAQRDAIANRDYNAMIAAGGNIYFLSKLGATDGKSFQYLAAHMTGSTQEEYAAMMLAGGRPAAGNTSRRAQSEKDKA